MRSTWATSWNSVNSTKKLSSRSTESSWASCLLSAKQLLTPFKTNQLSTLSLTRTWVFLPNVQESILKPLFIGNHLPRLYRHFRCRCLAEGTRRSSLAKLWKHELCRNRIGNQRSWRQSQEGNTCCWRHGRRNLHDQQRWSFRIIVGHTDHQSTTKRYPRHARNLWEARRDQRTGEMFSRILEWF